MKPTVSVIIPTYNRKELLVRAIDSVLKQTFQNFEIIIVDDGSNDGTQDIIRPYLTDSRIQYHFKTNEGLPSLSRNFAIKYAKGDFIAFLDCDDFWYPEKLEKQLALLNSNKDAVMSFCPARAITNNQELILGNEGWIKKNGHIFWWLILKNFIVTSSVIVKTQTIKEIGLFKSIKISEDFDLWLRITKKYKVAFLPEPMVFYQFHNSNISSNVMANIDCGDMVVRSHLENMKLPNFVKNFIHSLIPLKKFVRLKNNSTEALPYLNQAIRMAPWFLPYWGLKILYKIF